MKITNGKDVFEVTRGAFDNIYRKQGFVPFVDEAEETSEPGDDQPGMPDDEAFIADLKEKPIAQWTSEELKRYADVKGITAKANQLRKVIQKEIEDEELEDEELVTND